MFAVEAKYKGEDVLWDDSHETRESAEALVDELLTNDEADECRIFEQKPDNVWRSIYLTWTTEFPA